MAEVKGEKKEKYIFTINHLLGPEEMVPVFGKGNKGAIKWPHQAISSYKQKRETEPDTKCKKKKVVILHSIPQKHTSTLHIGQLKLQCIGQDKNTV